MNMMNRSTNFAAKQRRGASAVELVDGIAAGTFAVVSRDVETSLSLFGANSAALEPQLERGMSLWRNTAEVASPHGIIVERPRASE